MPDFSDPKYASYREFCRELRLLREWEPGDWLINENAGEPVLTQFVPGWHVRGLEAIWLPALADWLEMLEETGITYIGFAGPRGNYEWNYRIEGGRPSEEGVTFEGALTREEAAARLWQTLQAETLTRTPDPLRADPAT